MNCSDLCERCCCCKCFEKDKYVEKVDNESALAGSGRIVKYEPLRTADDEADDDLANIDVVLPSFEKIPVEKIFHFQQPTLSGYVHPQFFQQSVATSSTRVITEQPHPVPDDTTPCNQPTVYFSLYFDIQRRVLTVHLKSASTLELLAKPSKKRASNADLVSSAHTGRGVVADIDAFIMMFLIPMKEQTFYSSVKKSANPKFDETFDFTGLLPEEIRRQSLVFRFYNKTKQNELGIMLLPLQEADMYGVDLLQPITQTDAEKAIELQKYDTFGEVLLSLMYDTSDSIIYGVLMKAKNLQKMDIGGSSDPYVKINLLHKGERISKWKSSVKKKTLAPIYNENFQFNVTGMDLHFTKLQLVVLDHDILGSNDTMGLVEFGMKSGHKTGQHHWTEMTSSPNNQFCYWHALTASQPKRFSLK